MILHLSNGHSLIFVTTHHAVLLRTHQDMVLSRYQFYLLSSRLSMVGLAKAHQALSDKNSSTWRKLASVHGRIGECHRGLGDTDFQFFF